MVEARPSVTSGLFLQLPYPEVFLFSCCLQEGLQGSLALKPPHSRTSCTLRDMALLRAFPSAPGHACTLESRASAKWGPSALPLFLWVLTCLSGGSLSPRCLALPMASGATSADPFTSQGLCFLICTDESGVLPPRRGYGRQVPAITGGLGHPPCLALSSGKGLNHVALPGAAAVGGVESCRSLGGGGTGDREGRERDLHHRVLGSSTRGTEPRRAAPPPAAPVMATHSQQRWPGRPGLISLPGAGR